jgi:hypothetical protein
LAGKSRWRENHDDGKTEMAGKPKWWENQDGGKKRLVAEIQDLWKERHRRIKKMARKPKRSEKG